MRTESLRYHVGCKAAREAMITPNILIQIWGHYDLNVRVIPDFRCTLQRLSQNTTARVPRQSRHPLQPLMHMHGLKA